MIKTIKKSILWLIVFGLCLTLNIPNTFGDSPDLSLKTVIPDTNIAHHTYSNTEVTTNPLEVSVGDDKYPGIIYNNQKTFNGDTGEPNYQNGSYSYGINGTVYANNFGSTRSFGQSGDVEARKRVSMTNTPGVYKVDFDVRAIDYEPINTYVVIVFDLSSSMTQSTSSGKNKLTEAEKGAAELAKSLLNLNDSNNKTVHVGLVEFSGNVWLKNFTNNNHDTYLQIYKGNTQCTNGTNCNNINSGNPSYDNYTIQYNELSFATNTYFTTDASKYNTDMFHASYNGTNTQGIKVYKKCNLACSECFGDPLYNNDQVLTTNCKICKTNDFYYPLEYDESIPDIPLFCLLEAPQGYAKNETNPNHIIFSSCHENCLECNRINDEPNIDMHCTICKTGYHKFEFKETNCVKNCNRWAVDSSFNYICYENDNCPDPYPYFVEQTHQCVINCQDYNTCEYCKNNQGLFIKAIAY